MATIGRKRVQWAGYLCFLPAITLTAVFKLYPLAFGIFYSFTNWRGGPHWKFMARKLCPHDEGPGISGRHGQCGQGAGDAAALGALPLALAFLIFQETYGWRFFRATFVFPYIVAPVIAGYIFSFILGVDGPANQFLRAIGLDAIAVQWFGDSRTALWGLVGVALWSYFGLGVVIYLAGMANIPRDYFDAAKLDGASWLQQLIHVSIPLLLPTIGYWSVICTAGMLIWFFPYIYAITSGGPGYASMLPEYYIYQVSTKFFDPGLRLRHGAGAVPVYSDRVVRAGAPHVFPRQDRGAVNVRRSSSATPADPRLRPAGAGVGLDDLSAVFRLQHRAQDRRAIHRRPFFAGFPSEFRQLLARLGADGRRPRRVQLGRHRDRRRRRRLDRLPAGRLCRDQTPFSRPELLFLLILASMLIPIQTILYPFYLVVRNLGLLNQHAGLITAFVTFGIPVTTFQMAAYLRNVPDELIEAARVDGASLLQILLRVVVPICRPVLAVTGIINFIWMWNDILLPVLIMQTTESRTLMIAAGLMRGQWGSSSTLISAGLALAVVPVVVMFLLAQRQIIQGMTVGAVK